MSEAWADGPVTVHVGDVVSLLREMPSESVHCIVTSPPYWGLRDYGVAGQIGLEPTLQEYVSRMTEVFGEARRVLRRDGTLWLNLGDSYAGSSQTGGSGAETITGGTRNQRASMHGQRRELAGLKPKDLVMMPARIALALQADGWWLRADIIWAKPSPMPESVTDRPTTAHEHVFLLAKSARYFYDAEAVREPAQDWGLRDRSQAKHNGENFRAAGQPPHRGLTDGNQAAAGRNLRSVWTIASEPFAEAHFATFPSALAGRCIAAGTSERGCCPECGAPWARVVERAGDVPMTARRSHLAEMATNGTRLTMGGGTARSSLGAGVGGDVPARTSTTIGWRPTCTHGARTDRITAEQCIREWFGADREDLWRLWEVDARKALKADTDQILLARLRQEGVERIEASTCDRVQEGEHPAELSGRPIQRRPRIRVREDHRAPDGEQERLRAGASPGVGESAWLGVGAGGDGRASHQRHPERQPAGESAGGPEAKSQPRVEHQAGAGPASEGRGRVASAEDPAALVLIPHPPTPTIVLDPFAGSGTTLAVARRMGRRSLGIELQRDYLALIQRRVAEAALPLLEAAT